MSQPSLRAQGRAPPARRGIRMPPRFVRARLAAQMLLGSGSRPFRARRSGGDPPPVTPTWHPTPPFRLSGAGSDRRHAARRCAARVPGPELGRSSLAEKSGISSASCRSHFGSRAALAQIFLGLQLRTSKRRAAVASQIGSRQPLEQPRSHGGSVAQEEAAYARPLLEVLVWMREEQNGMVVVQTLQGGAFVCYLHDTASSSA